MEITGSSNHKQRKSRVSPHFARDLAEEQGRERYFQISQAFQLNVSVSVELIQRMDPLLLLHISLIFILSNQMQNGAPFFLFVSLFLSGNNHFKCILFYHVHDLWEERRMLFASCLNEVLLVEAWVNNELERLKIKSKQTRQEAIIKEQNIKNPK